MVKTSETEWSSKIRVKWVNTIFFHREKNGVEGRIGDEIDIPSRYNSIDPFFLFFLQPDRRKTIRFKNIVRLLSSSRSTEGKERGKKRMIRPPPRTVIL